MPGKDITDSLKILVDQNDNFVRYKLTKKTCGGDVGRRAMLTKWLKDKPVSEILELTPEELSQKDKTLSDVTLSLDFPGYLDAFPVYSLAV